MSTYVESNLEVIYTLGSVIILYAVNEIASASLGFIGFGCSVFEGEGFDMPPDSCSKDKRFEVGPFAGFTAASEELVGSVRLFDRFLHISIACCTAPSLGNASEFTTLVAFPSSSARSGGACTVIVGDCRLEDAFVLIDAKLLVELLVEGTHGRRSREIERVQCFVFANHGLAAQ